MQELIKEDAVLLFCEAPIRYAFTAENAAPHSYCSHEVVFWNWLSRTSYLYLVVPPRDSVLPFTNLSKFLVDHLIENAVNCRRHTLLSSELIDLCTRER